MTHDALNLTDFGATPTAATAASQAPRRAVSWPPSARSREADLAPGSLMDGPPLRILLIEDSPSDAILLREGLRQSRLQSFDVTVAERMEEAVSALAQGSFDVVLLDLALPDTTGLETLTRAREAAPHLPILVLTGADDEMIGVEAVRQGMQDYLVKGQVDGRSLARAILYAIERKRAKEELQRAHDELELRVEERTAQLSYAVKALRALALDLTHTEQRERMQLARFVHDEIQQFLVGARFRVKAIKSRSTDCTIQADLDHVTETLDDALRAARSLSMELCPPAFHEKGLAPGLSWLRRSMMERHKLDVQLEIQQDIEAMREEVRLFLLEAVRELLLNVVKHADVRKARVQLKKLANDRLVVTVSDSGTGFDKQVLERGPEPQGGFGLFSIRQRLSHLGGSMDVDASPGHGCSFTLIAPLE